MSEIAVEKEIDIPQGTWVIDNDNSSIGFITRHLGVNKVRGRFNRFQGEMVVGQDLVDSSITVNVKAASIDSGQKERDRHLISADFLDASKYPDINFTSLAIEPRSWGELMIIGELFLHGTTNQLELDGELHGISQNERGETVLALGMSGALSRSEYGIKFNRTLAGGNLLVGDEVLLEIDAAARLVD